MQSIAFSVCDCDEVRLVGYSEENFRTYAYIEIIGAEEKSKRQLALKINEVLKKGIDKYCSIDRLTLDFVNKGEHEVIVIRYCKLDE